jgi:alkylation response protein AidB-like acyl-CoA dehydrogenase
VAHRLVDHTITVAQMRLLLEDSAEAFDRQVEGLTRRAAICLTYFAARGAAIVSDCIQLAGAIGFTWEFGHHFYLRRVVATTAVACAGQRPQRALASEQPW